MSFGNSYPDYQQREKRITKRATYSVSLLTSKKAEQSPGSSSRSGRRNKNNYSNHGVERMKNLILIVALLSSSIGFQMAYGATVIAHSLSTREVARSERSFSQNDEILVVCRSNLSYPLDRTYSSIDALDRDARSQLNITGIYFQVYSFSINSDGSVTQQRNKKFKAD